MCIVLVDLLYELSPTDMMSYVSVLMTAYPAIEPLVILSTIRRFLGSVEFFGERHLSYRLYVLRKTIGMKVSSVSIAGNITAQYHGTSNTR